MKSRIAMAAQRVNLEGGIENCTMQLVRGLTQRGVPVDVFAVSVVPRPDSPARVRPVPLSRASSLSFASPITFSRRATTAVRLNGPYDLVHNQGGCALREQDIITAHSCHRAWVEVKRRTGQRLQIYANPLHASVLRVEAANYRPGKYRQVIAVSEGLKSELMGYYRVPAERITVIPNGVDLEHFKSADRERRRTLVRQRHAFQAEDVVVAFVSKEFRRKGLEPLIRALPSLPVNVKALVVGGDTQTRFRTLARHLGVEDRVLFAGHTSDVAGHLYAADVFCLPSLYEAFALVTLEAAAAGLPLVTTEVNGTAELLIEGKSGLKIERSAESVGAALLTLAKSPQLRASLGAGARTQVQSYTWEAMTERTLAVYEEVLDMRRSEVRRK